jgi:uncharacterized protein DUF3263
MSDLRRSLSAVSTGELSDRDRAVLDFAGRTYLYRGAQEQAILDEFNLSPARFWQIVNRLVDTEAAIAYAPVTCRLYRERRQAQRDRRTG